MQTVLTLSGIGGQLYTSPYLPVASLHLMWGQEGTDLNHTSSDNSQGAGTTKETSPGAGCTGGRSGVLWLPGNIASAYLGDVNDRIQYAVGYIRWVSWAACLHRAELLYRWGDLQFPLSFPLHWFPEVKSGGWWLLWSQKWCCEPSCTSSLHCFPCTQLCGSS